MRLKFGSYELSVGNPGLGGIYWWISLERYRNTFKDAATGFQHQAMHVIFRLQYHDIMPTYSNPRGGREWRRIA